MKKFIALTRDPIFVMCVVIAMYVLKSAAKLTIGSAIHSPMLSGDGCHNLADIGEALAVIVLLKIAATAASKQYPFGRKNIEFVSNLGIGGTLLVLSVQFGFQSLIGLLAQIPIWDQFVRHVIPLPKHEALVMDVQTLPVVLSVTGISALLSILVSRYQIAVGKEQKRASLEADGAETASDGVIEGVAFAGIIGEYLLHAPGLEYVLGLLVAYLISKTGRELFSSGMGMLLQKSIGCDEQIESLCLMVSGVESVLSLKTFATGHTAHVILEFTTLCPQAKVEFIKYGIKSSIQEYLLAQDEFRECEVYCDGRMPNKENHRIAYAIQATGEGKELADCLTNSNALIICDVECGRTTQAKQIACPSDPIRLLTKKRVTKVFLFDPTESGEESFCREGIIFSQSPVKSLHLQGFPETA